ncbi:MAG: hypothetical protein HGA22_00205 [Clostridiales bacterium]|nr:hypothetical protein [Clostridiales bacterium]
MLYVFIGCLGFGVLYSAVSLFLGHGFGHDMGGHADFGGHADLTGNADITGNADLGSHNGTSGHTDASDMPSPFNPLVLASAITTFGAVGLIARQGFGMGDIFSTLVALAFAGAIGAIIFFGVVRLMYSSQSNSVFSLEDIAGTEAEVITPIPAEGLGEIAYVANGMRYNMPARSSEKVDLGRDDTVIIRSVTGNAAVVQKKLTIDEIDIEAFGWQDGKPEKNNNIGR